MFISAASSSSAISGSTVEIRNPTLTSSKTNSAAQGFFSSHSWLSSLAIGAIAAAAAIPALGLTTGLAIGAGVTAVAKLAISYFSPEEPVVSLEQQDQARSLSSESDTLLSSSSSQMDEAAPYSTSSASSLRYSSISSKANVGNPPIGLNRESNNCWANSLFQFLMNSPYLRESVRRCSNVSSSGVSMGQMIDQYMTDQNNFRQSDRQISTINTQNFREIIHSIAPFMFSVRSSDPQDPYPAFTALSPWIPKFTMQNVFSYENLPQPSIDQSSNNSASAPLIQLGRNQTFTRIFTEGVTTFSLKKISSSNNLKTLLDNYFEGTDLTRRSTLRINTPNTTLDPIPSFLVRKIVNPPQDLSINLQGDTIPINIPPTITLEKSKHTLSENADYILDSFILGLDCGSIKHYITYIQKNGRWFECNDSFVSEVTREAALLAARRAHVIHFSKIN